MAALDRDREVRRDLVADLRHDVPEIRPAEPGCEIPLQIVTGFQAVAFGVTPTGAGAEADPPFAFAVAHVEADARLVHLAEEDLGSPHLARLVERVFVDLGARLRARSCARRTLPPRPPLLRRSTSRSGCPCGRWRRSACRRRCALRRRTATTFRSRPWPGSWPGASPWASSWSRRVAKVPLLGSRYIRKTLSTGRVAATAHRTTTGLSRIVSSLFGQSSALIRTGRSGSSDSSASHATALRGDGLVVLLVVGLHLGRRGGAWVPVLQSPPAPAAPPGVGRSSGRPARTLPSRRWSRCSWTARCSDRSPEPSRSSACPWCGRENRRRRPRPGERRSARRSDASRGPLSWRC